MTELNDKKLCESCFEETDSDVCPKCGFNRSEYVSDPLVLPMGTKLNESIVIGRVMGKGGFGVTYLGYDLRMNKIIAVKEYYPNGIAYRTPAGTEVSLADAESAETFDKGAEKFYAEAEMVAQFNGNPNIVSVYDYFRENNTVYLVMEYISGITLKNYVKRHGKLTDGQALYVMDKIAAALSITHSAGVLHRDISPDNIMVCMDGKVKLIDFGAARQIMAESSSNLTVVMKPGYTPIEQYTKKGKQGAWTDIYSLGVSVYYALTGVIIDDPYARMDDDSELEENKHGINGDLWAILKKCTMINAPDRYGSAIELRKALRAVSAPIKPQPLSLDEDDLKIEEETAVAPDIISENISEEKDFPVTAASDNDEDAVSAIETFEESSAAPSDNVKETPALVKSPDKKKSNKGIIASVCAAAVIIIGIFIAGKGTADENNFTTESAVTNAAEITESSVTTAKKADTAEDTTVTTVPERDEETTVSTVTAAPETTSKTTSADEPATTTTKSQTTTAQTTTTNPPAVTTKPPAVTTKPPAVTTKPPAVTTKPPAVTTKPPVVTTKPPAVTTPEPVTTTTAVTKADINDKVINFDGIYPGDWSIMSKGIPLSDLTCFDGDVEITLIMDLNVRKDRSWLDFGLPASYVCPVSDKDWSKLNVSVDNLPPPGDIGDDMYMLEGTGERRFTFTVSQEELKNKKCRNEVYIQVCNCTVKKAYIKNGVHTYDKLINFDGKYPGDWSVMSNGIPLSDLTCYDGDVRITLDLDINVCGDRPFWDNPDILVSYICPVSDKDWSKLNISVDNMPPPGDHGGDMYELIGTSNRRFTFTVSQKELKNKQCRDEVYIQLCNCTVKKAYIESAD